MADLVDRLREFSPCLAGVRWLSGFTSAQAAWDECREPAWMIWYIKKTLHDKPDFHRSRRKFLACCLDCVRIPRKYQAEVAILRQWIADGKETEEFIDAVYRMQYNAPFSIGAVTGAAKEYGYPDSGIALAHLPARSCDVIRSYYPRCPRLPR